MKSAQCHKRVWSGAYFGVMRLSDKSHWCTVQCIMKATDAQFIQARDYSQYAGHLGNTSGPFIFQMFFFF